MKKRVAILGATGSIGKNALDVIAQKKDDFELVLLSAHNKIEELAELCRQWPNARTVLSNGEEGRKSLLDAIAGCGADITLNGIAGSAGLAPSMAALEAGSDLALANKETLVMAGSLVIQKAKEKNVNIIPVDSEHSAIFHLIKAHGRESLDEIILTASGGPFRNYSVEEMAAVNPRAALAHPTWNMGPKISIDSASMANKGLEVIEAAVLFNLPSEKIKVLIHPQSIVHSMIHMNDGAIYAQLSRPDMRLPIHKALYWPETSPSDLERLDFNALTLEFFLPDTQKFPLLTYAYEVVNKGSLFPCAFNSANEAAVAAFLNGRITFPEISRVTHNVLDTDWSAAPENISQVLEADKQAKEIAEEIIRNR